VLHATGGNSFVWTPASSLNDANISDPIAFPSFTTEYIVKVSDTGICSGFDTVMVTVNPFPLADAGNDQIVCAGNIFQLSASGGIQYLWSPADGLSSATISNPTAFIDSSITYVVAVTDQYSCSATDSIHLEIAPPLISSINYDTSICKGASAQLLGQGGVIYSWSPSNFLNDATIAAPLATPDSTTTFYLIVSDGLCYSDTLAVIVYVSDPTVNAGVDVVLSDGQTYQMQANASAGTYEWSPAEGLSCTDCINPVATPLQTTTYTVVVTDSVGCTASDDITLFVGCSEEDLFIPNAFTPDNNGHNDFLFVRGNGSFHLNYFRIFDRWGKIIFETNDISTGWDGSYKNKPVSPGVFLYILEAECSAGMVIRKQGNITLLR
jgi:gliding motility-associated-like protein